MAFHCKTVRNIYNLYTNLTPVYNVQTAVQDRSVLVLFQYNMKPQVSIPAPEPATLPLLGVPGCDASPLHRVVGVPGASPLRRLVGVPGASPRRRLVGVPSAEPRPRSSPCSLYSLPVSSSSLPRLSSDELPEQSATGQNGHINI